MTRRIKPSLSLQQIVTRADADRIMGIIREIEIERRQEMLEIESKRKAIEDKHAPRLTEITDELQALSQQLEAWGDNHRSEFGDRKSLVLTHGEMGWRLSPPALKTLKKVTWKDVLHRLGALRFRRFIRNKPEVAKDVILTHREKLAARGLLVKIGVEVEQKDVFFVEPKIDEGPAQS
jgi:phage host-nuclease inhibitor protein Gam